MSVDSIQQKNFSSQGWLCYFQRNRLQRAAIPWERGISLEAQQREPLLRSLQRFQVGEQGDGRHLLQAAAKTHDPAYQAAVDLFIKEEQEHSRLLAKIIVGLDGKLLRRHWSDSCFVILRRLCGLRLELLVLLVAEVIAQVYYKVLHDGTTDEVFRGVCTQILHDEHGHVAFHCSYLHQAFSAYSLPARWLISISWSLLFRLVCLIVICDHFTAFKAVGMAPRACWRACMQAFQEARSQISFIPLSNGH